MLSIRCLATLAVLMSALPLAAQQGGEPAAQAPTTDTVVLTNGDTLTGALTKLADGKLYLKSALLGDLEIPIDAVKDLQTAGNVTIQTSEGERFQRRIGGIENGALRLVGGEQRPQGNVPVADVTAINPEEPEIKWTGAINAGFGLSTGNTERRSANASVEAQRRSKNDRITGTAQWNYAEEKSDGAWSLTERRLEGSLQYDYFVTDCDYLLARTGALGDARANLSLRYTAGVGYGRQLFDSEDLSLSAETGINYFYEDYSDATPTNETVAARLAYNLRWEITDGLAFLQDVQYLPSTERLDDYYITKKSRVRLSFTEAMFAQLEWQLEYDSTPAIGKDRLDNRYFLSVGWAF